MNELVAKQKRSEFVATVGHLLADRGVRHWQGLAAAHYSAPKDRIVVLTSQNVLQDLVATSYHAGQVAQKVELARIKLNWRFGFPARIREVLGTATRGLRLELTCRAVDLPDLAFNVAALMLGEASESRDYLWDERAVEGLLPDTRDLFQRRGFLRSPVQPGLRALPSPASKRSLRGVP